MTNPFQLVTETSIRKALQLIRNNWKVFLVLILLFVLLISWLTAKGG